MDTRTLMASDTKEAATNFMIHNFKERGWLEHVVQQACDMCGNTEEVPCLVCPKDSCTHDPSIRPHLVTVGLPCQPYSSLRWRSGNSDDQKNARSHNKFGCMQDFLDYLAARKPHGFILEEVKGFLAKD